LKRTATIGAGTRDPRRQDLAGIRAADKRRIVGERPAHRRIALIATIAPAARSSEQNLARTRARRRMAGYAAGWPSGNFGPTIGAGADGSRRAALARTRRAPTNGGCRPPAGRENFGPTSAPVPKQPRICTSRGYAGRQQMRFCALGRDRRIEMSARLVPVRRSHAINTRAGHAHRGKRGSDGAPGVNFAAIGPAAAGNQAISTRAEPARRRRTAGLPPAGKREFRPEIGGHTGGSHAI